MPLVLNSLLPSTSRSLRLASLWAKRDTMGWLPSSAANIIGARPLLSCTLGSAPLERRKVTSSARRKRESRNNPETDHIWACGKFSDQLGLMQIMFKSNWKYMFIPHVLFPQCYCRQWLRCLANLITSIFHCAAVFENSTCCHKSLWTFSLASNAACKQRHKD